MSCKMKFFLLFITVIVFTLIAISFAQDTQFIPQTSGETLNNLIAVNAKLLLGTSQAVYRLSSILSLEERRALESGNRLLIADNQNGTHNGTVLSCDEGSCLLLEAENLSNVRWEVPRTMVLFSGGGNAAGIFSIGPNGTSDITFGEPSSGNVARRFVKGALKNLGSASTSEFLQYATWHGDDISGVNYLNSFIYSDYIYFTIQLETDIHVIRFCQKDPGFKSNLQRFFATRYEIRLRCAASGQHSINDMSTAATYLPASSLYDSPVVFLSVNYMSEHNVVVNNVCAFSVNDINQKMLDKLSSCANGDGFVDFDSDVACPTHFSDNQTQTQISEPCQLRSVLAGGLEVQDPLQEMAVITNVSFTSEQYTSLLAMLLDGAVFLFVGTNTGKVHQFHLSRSNQSVFVRTIDLDVSQADSTIVTKMLASVNRDYLYAMTASKLYSHTVDMCNTFISCYSCTTSRDPVCGWCSLIGRCTRQKVCTPVTDRTGISQTVWISTCNSCPVISQTTPTVIYFPELAATVGESIAIHLVTSNIATLAKLQNFDYQCWFAFNVPSSVPVATVAVRSGDMFSCRSPLDSQIPSLTNGKDTVDTILSIRVVQTNTDLVTLAIPLGFTDCFVHRNCTGCITSGMNKCRWCIFSFNCIPDKQSFNCNNSDNSTGLELTVGHNGECPLIKPSPLTMQYLIHVNHQYPFPPLLVTTSNLSPFRSLFAMGEFNCVLCWDVSCTKPLFTVPATLEGSGVQVRCEEITYSTELDIATQDIELRVVGNGDRRIDNPQSAKVTIYDCTNLGTNCGQCLSVPTRYSCSYCGPLGGGHCQLDFVCMGEEFSYSNTSQFMNCESPTITRFSPIAAPTTGGTEVKIMGTNLGAVRDHVMNVTIGGVMCYITEYVPGVMIKCMTSHVESSLITDKISVILKYWDNPVVSQEEFMFKDPVLLNPPANPNQGPQSGGTNITVNGHDLGIGSNHEVFIGTRPCEVTSVLQDVVHCTTSMSNIIGVGQFVRVQVDNWTSEISGYTYTEDPKFMSIEPKLFFASGGINFTIKGSRLDSVQNPRLLVYVNVASGGRTQQVFAQERLTLVSETCLNEGSETLYCPAPAVDLNGTSADVSFGLLMDNVMSLSQLNSSLTVHADPNFHSFPTEKIFSQTDRISLTIEGEHFIFISEQVRVRVSPCTTDFGYCDCVVNNITDQDTLTCEVANVNDLPPDQALQVTVHVGYYNQSVGTVRVQSPSNLSIFLISIFGSVIVLFTAIFFVIIVVLCLRRNKKHLVQQNFELTDHEERTFNNSPGVPSTVFTSQITDDLMKNIPDSLKIPCSHLTLSTTAIGQGEFGVVYKALLNKWNGKESQLVAIKTLKGLFSPSDVQNMILEVMKMQEFHHPHVMSLIGVCLDAGVDVSIVLPYMGNGSLLDYLKKERDSLELDDDSEVDQILAVRKLLLKMCHQISLGMKYLAHQRFIHRDLAARNCMLDRSGNIKVGDFGLSEDVYGTGYFRQQDRQNVKLPFKWMAPESLNDAIFTEKTDVWSYGVTMWEIFSCGRTPYPAIDPMSLIKLLREGRRLERPDNAASSTEIFVIMRKCWREAPDDRPDFAKLVSISERLLFSIADYTELDMNLLEGGNEDTGCNPLEQIETNHDMPYDIPTPLNASENSDDMNVTDNAAYGTSDDMNVTDNVANGTSDDMNVTDNVANGTSDMNVTDNVAYGTSDDMNVTDNVANGTSDDMNVADNVAFGTSDGMNVTDNVAYGTSDGMNVTDNVAYAHN